jgi:transcription elongation factor Elf1
MIITEDGIEKKKCPTCGIVKTVNEFFKRRDSKDGYRYQCIMCEKKYHLEHRQHALEYGINYYKIHKNEQLERARSNYVSHPGGRLKTSIPKEELYDLYIVKQWATSQIAEKYHVCRRTIRMKLIEYGIPRRTLSESMQLAIKSGRFKQLLRENNPRWTGKTRRKEGGYIIVRVPFSSPYSCVARKNGYIKEHRLVMMEHLGRPLLKTEYVHHINGIGTDNRIENLQLVSTQDHSIKTLLCSKCELRKEIRLMRLQIKMLQEQLQGKVIS